MPAAGFAAQRPPLAVRPGAISRADGARGWKAHRPSGRSFILPARPLDPHLLGERRMKALALFSQARPNARLLLRRHFLAGQILEERYRGFRGRRD
jgi:hypothetical protein